MSKIFWFFLFLVFGTLAGCVGTYKLDIQQGNVVTSAMVSELQLGMTKREVRFVLGTPLVNDPFHADRWDYLYSFRKGGAKESEQKNLTVTFKDDLLINIKGDIALADAANVAEDGAEEKPKKKKKKKKKKGFFSRTWERIWD